MGTHLSKVEGKWDQVNKTQKKKKKQKQIINKNR
jgi:hypothetical protein